MRKPMKSASYTLARKFNEPRMKSNAGKFEVQKTSDHNKGHSQEWMKMNVLNEVDQCIEYGWHMTRQTWGVSNTLRHLEFIQFGGWTHNKLLVTPSVVTGPRIMVTTDIVIGGEKIISCDLTNSL